MLGHLTHPRDAYRVRNGDPGFTWDRTQNENMIPDDDDDQQRLDYVFVWDRVPEGGKSSGKALSPVTVLASSVVKYGEDAAVRPLRRRRDAEPPGALSDARSAVGVRGRAHEEGRRLADAGVRGARASRCDGTQGLEQRLVVCASRLQRVDDAPASDRERQETGGDLSRSPPAPGARPRRLGSPRSWSSASARYRGRSARPDLESPREPARGVRNRSRRRSRARGRGGRLPERGPVTSTSRARWPRPPARTASRA